MYLFVYFTETNGNENIEMKNEGNGNIISQPFPVWALKSPYNYT